VANSIKQANETKKEIKVIDLEAEENDENIRTKLASMDKPKDPFKNFKFEAEVARGLSKQITNRNYSFEDKLKTLSEKMIEVLEEKPDQDEKSLIEKFKPPKGLDFRF
jgi:hypothetical protein